MLLVCTCSKNIKYKNPHNNPTKIGYLKINIFHSMIFTPGGRVAYLSNSLFSHPTKITFNLVDKLNI
jgi:hypothetical protein